MTNKNTTWMLEEDKVDPAAGCPRCGERRTDYLVWVDDGEQVKCGTCGEVYRP